MEEWGLVALQTEKWFGSLFWFFSRIHMSDSVRISYFKLSFISGSLELRASLRRDFQRETSPFEPVYTSYSDDGRYATAC